MQNKIVLISDDSDFFEYIIPKLKLRKSDEIFQFKYEELPDKIHMLSSALLIINSENHQEQTLQLLDIIKDTPTVIFGYNHNDEFVLETYKKGALCFLTLSASDEEIEAKLIPALNLVSYAEKSALYREMLVNNNIISKNNEVFLDFTNVLEREINNIHKNSVTSTLTAIAADDKTKFILQPNQLETIILNSIRKNDILMSYSFNKYFLLLNNTNIEKAKSIWKTITNKLPQGVYAGFALIGNKSRQQVVNEVLNDLHKSMSQEKIFPNIKSTENTNNFKSFRKEFDKKILQIVSPVFYHIQQKHNDKLYGIYIEQEVGEGYGVMYLKSEKFTASFRITCPGFSSVNIDISYINADTCTNNKRITLEPEELEAGLLEDLLEEFIKEYKQTVENNC